MIRSLCLVALLLLAGQAAAQPMPPLPDAIKQAGILRVGTRCDQPPYGFQDASGTYAGVEVEMAKQIAAYAFGDPAKVEFTCVTAENRIPQLVAKKVDILLATLGITPERARVIDFTDNYNWGAGDLLVLKDSPVTKLDDVKTRTVVMLKGTTQAAWFDANMPDLNTLRLNSISDALQALKQHRAEAMAGDDATLIVIAARDPDLRRVGELYGASGAGVGVRKNEPATLAYMNAALVRMRTESLFLPWIEKWVPAENRENYVRAFTGGKPNAR